MSFSFKTILVCFVLCLGSTPALADDYKQSFNNLSASSGERQHIEASSTTYSGIKVPGSERASFGKERSFTTQRASCDVWWINGSHRWEWSGLAGFRVKRSMSGSTDTFWGSDDPDACGRPGLPVDRIEVSGTSIPGCSPCNGCGYQSCMTVSKTSYDTNHVSVYKSQTGYLGNADTISGASFTHEAEKNGITCSTRTRSGE